MAGRRTRCASMLRRSERTGARSCAPRGSASTERPRPGTPRSARTRWNPDALEPVRAGRRRRMPAEAKLIETGILQEAVPAPRAWHGPDLSEDDFKVSLPEHCLAELEAVVGEQRRAPVPTLVLEPQHFQMEACRALMAGARQRLAAGLGFLIFDRLPVERWAPQEIIDVYWLLASLLEVPVAQEWKGTMIYDVRWDGHGYSADTRAALTPEGLDMHNDS